jgi:Flp pilus assembly protein TadD
MTERDSNDGDLLHRSGVSAYQNGDLKTALEHILKAIEINSNAAEYYNTFGVILAQAGREQGAIKAYRKAIELNNNYGAAYSNLGNCLQKQNKYAESIEYYAKAIKINPDYAEAYNNLAAGLYKLGNFEAAIENCRKAIKLKANFAETYNTLAACLQAEQRFDEAIECYDKTVEYAPDYAEAYYSRGMLYLCHGQFAKGWDDYQWRLKTEKTKVTLRYDKPWWQGENFQDKTLLVQAEQGFGDSIQFVRYLPMVKERGGTVILAEKSELIGLFRDLEGIDDLVDIRKVAEGNVKYDLYVTLLSLPAIFGTNIDSIPARIPYLSAKASKIAYWHDKIKTDAFKIGIAWAGNPTHDNEHNRSCTLEDFIQLAKLENVTLFSLQKGTAIEQINNWPEDLELIDLGHEFEDFTDTAAVIENMDLTISVDTCVLHLAGAMGKTAWGLIAHEPDWRWMLNRGDSPWYPTIRLFRQKEHGNWEELSHRVTEQLKILIEKQMVTNNKYSGAENDSSYNSKL